MMRFSDPPPKIPAVGADGPDSFFVGGVLARRKASSSIFGSVLPRFAARRKIPAQAFGLKKYLSGTAPVSKISDNEDATTALGDSEKLCVFNDPGKAVERSSGNACAWPDPAFEAGDKRSICPNKSSEEASKSVVGGVEPSRDVFGETPSRLNIVYCSDICE
jgi:hypothetical protein